MTPQTLMNDLATQNCDIMDIILIVIGTTWSSFLSISTR